LYIRGKKEAFIEKLAGVIKNLKELQDNYNLKPRNTGRGRPGSIDSRINLILNGVSKYFDVSWVILNDKLKIEQTFRFLKTDMKIRPFWLRKKDRVIAYFFISYLAYFLKCIIEYRLKNHD